MKKVVLACIFVLLCISNAVAESALIGWTEPTASGTLAYTTVYYCTGVSCVNWVTSSELRKKSDNGNGGDAQSLTIVVPLVQGTLPKTFRVKITATDVNQNETSGAIQTHVFN